MLVHVKMLKYPSEFELVTYRFHNMDVSQTTLTSNQLGNCSPEKNVDYHKNNIYIYIVKCILETNPKRKISIKIKVYCGAMHFFPPNIKVLKRPEKYYFLQT